MALVPFSVSGASAGQDLDQRLIQVGPYSLVLRQRPGASGNTAHLQHAQTSRQVITHEHEPEAQNCHHHHQQQQQHQHKQLHQQQPDLSNVGLVLWQSGYVLSDFLLLRSQAAGGAVGSSSSSRAATSCSPISWAGVRVLELGCGGGTVGMFLALAGAQVVLTDQAHILPLTNENLTLNFPATAAGYSSGDKQQRHPAADPAPGSYSHQQDGQHNQQKQQSAHGLPAGPSSPSRPALSASAAFAAAFSAASSDAHRPPAHTQQGIYAQQQLASSVFVPGPLVVEYTWGEPLHVLHSRVAAAAAARVDLSAAEGPSGSTAAPLPEGQAGEEVVQHKDVGSETVTCSSAKEFGSGEAPVHQQLHQLAAQGFDVIVGADLLYDANHHAALLTSLQQLVAASPHAEVFLCWRCRALGEEAFLDAAGTAGWVIQQVGTGLLHPEFQTGYYKLARLVRLP